jgi:arylsulfatase A-like enzyme
VYAAQVEEMDTAIGRLMGALREMGQERNTLVLFFSDNGGAAERPVSTLDGAKLGTRDSYEGYAIDGAHVSSAPFRKTKKFTHEGGIASPLVAYWPAGIPASLHGTLNREPAHVIDLMATCLELAGAGLPPAWNGNRTPPLEGISIVPTLSGRPLARPQPMFWEHEGHRAVRDGNLKLVASHGDPWELYDLAADRTETTDLAAARPGDVRRLVATYEAWARRAGVRPWTTLGPAAGQTGAKAKKKAAP